MYNVITGQFEAPSVVLYGYEDPSDADTSMVISRDEDNVVYTSHLGIFSEDQARNLIKALEFALEHNWWG